MRPLQTESGEWHLAESVAERVLAIYAEAFGSAEPLFAHAGRSVDGGSLLRSLPVADLARMTSQAINELARRDAVMVGRRGLGPCDWRVIMYSLTSARTLREAIMRCCDCFEAIDWRCGKMALRTHGDRAELQLQAMRPGGSTSAGCLIDLFGLMEIHGLFGWLIDHAIPARNAWLNHAPEIFEALNLPVLPFPVRLNEGWSGFDFSASLLDYPVMRSWEDQHRRPLSNLLFVSNPQEADRTPTEIRVRGIAMAALKNDQRLPSFGEIVTALGEAKPRCAANWRGRVQATVRCAKAAVANWRCICYGGLACRSRKSLGDWIIAIQTPSAKPFVHGPAIPRHPTVWEVAQVRTRENFLSDISRPTLAVSDRSSGGIKNGGESVNLCDRFSRRVALRQKRTLPPQCRNRV